MVFEYLVKHKADKIKAVTLPEQVDENGKWILWNEEFPQEES